MPDGTRYCQQRNATGIGLRNQTHLLQQLYGEVVIPPAVEAELYCWFRTRYQL